jgi:hypothetical protein
MPDTVPDPQWPNGSIRENGGQEHPNNADRPPSRVRVCM